MHRDITVRVLFSLYLDNKVKQFYLLNSFTTIKHPWFWGPWHPSTYHMRPVPSSLCLDRFLSVVSKWSVSGRGDRSVGKLLASHTWGQEIGPQTQLTGGPP